ncbi:hypothetical protein A2153_04205 [Candidatus Gottesmanbacteria bacterium RBG_16_38_7b]|uniref:BrnT family toxin n=1 Tax=Candidatus Gottesmanbacteria bacterium RBG_16_38_7b TaxID=1798372 RepID=A0A1F5YEQ0_9BACT|nr:MAG: hypothetical protein A2153_04205 [Candidatus Gottesmanbacteria bacterium RBG_16_38_7b]
MSLNFDLSRIVGFDWDNGNIDKNLKKHKVTNEESEGVFFNNPYVSEDIRHSEKEQRLQALGKTNQGRLLFISFTIRKLDQKLKIRVISCRDMNRKEEVKYEKIQRNT